MKVTHLDHFTIVAQPGEIERLREFYCETLGLEPGPRPDFPFPGYWLYPPGGTPIVHLAGITGRAPPEGPRDTGKLDHVSFRATGLDEIRRHLAALGIDFREAPVPGFPLHQVFFRDPVGIKVELTFELGIMRP
jgi:catechol 2,3-dioxygenase-like lactoylglutathione lyase family enzyme